MDEEVGEAHRVLWDRRRSSQHYFVLIVEHPDGLASLLRRVLNTSHKARVGDCFARVRVYINMCKGGLWSISPKRFCFANVFHFAFALICTNFRLTAQVRLYSTKDN